MPMEFINQNIMLVGLVAVSGLSLLWPLLVRPSGNSVVPVEATQLIGTLGGVSELIKDALTEKKGQG